MMAIILSIPLDNGESVISGAIYGVVAVGTTKERNQASVTEYPSDQNRYILYNIYTTMVWIPMRMKYIQYNPSVRV